MLKENGLRVIICSKCFNLKASIQGFFGDTSYCPVCKKTTKIFHIKKGSFNIEEKELLKQVLWDGLKETE